MVVETGETIPQLLHTAASLRRARRMQRECMLRWALEKRRAQGDTGFDPSPITDARNCDWERRLPSPDPDMDD
jgi:hypothetical protein